jgi:hypothetical protein
MLRPNTGGADGISGRSRGAAAGIGLRAPHVAEILGSRPSIPWLEVHPENYMGGGLALAQLARIRLDYPIALHGVGLSLGSVDGIDTRHLSRMRALAERIEPGLVSEHLAWSTTGGAYLNHLLPLPYTDETLDVVARNVAAVQDSLGRSILVENPSSYLRFRHSTIPEPEFLAALVGLTGCSLLCDVNNIFVSAHNLGLDAEAYLDALPASAVGEIHLAGHARNEAGGRSILIDDHGSRVADAVWALYARALGRFGPTPTLIEWDTDLPELAVLLAEAATAGRLMDAAARSGDGHARAR